MRAPTPTVAPRIPGSFVPPPARRRCTPGGQPWPKDKNGRDWPKDRWGRPMRPLWDYPPGVRAPGEGVAPGEPGSISTADAINAYLRAEAMFADPLGMASAALATPDPANVSAIPARDPAAAQTDALGTQVATVLLMDDTPHQTTAHTLNDPEQDTTDAGSISTGNRSSGTAQDPDLHGYSHIGKNNFLKVGWGDTNFYPSQWDLVQQITTGYPMTFVAGNTIAIEASSLAYPPTNQFRWAAAAQPLNADGTPHASLSTPSCRPELLNTHRDPPEPAPLRTLCFQQPHPLRNSDGRFRFLGRKRLTGITLTTGSVSIPHGANIESYS